jgi:transcriptional regulator with XRE-family HTH domain
MELSERLKSARKRTGLTQDDVARHFGINRVSVTQWELGISRPDQTKFVELARLFSVPLEWLIEGTGPAPEPKQGTKRSAPSSARDKFVKSLAFKFYVRDWREFMGVKVEVAAKAAHMDPDQYQAFETYPINFNLQQVVSLAEVIGVRGDQFWFPPPKRRDTQPSKGGRSKARSSLG